jgi:hypothetical protein
VKRLALAVFLTACTVVPSAMAQQNEISGLIGRTFISDQGIQGSNSFDNNLRFGKGLTFEGNYARRLRVYPVWSLSAEVPVVINIDEDIHAPLPFEVPESYKSFMVTPAARVNIFPTTAVSPWFSGGGGFAHFSESSNLLFVGKNTGNRGTTTGALELGAGLDVRFFKSFILRGAFRDFWTGVPQLNVDTGKSHQHNYFVGAGLVWQF